MTLSSNTAAELEIRTLAVWGRARYLSVPEAPHNIEFSRVSGEETFCFFETWMPDWGSNPRSQTLQADSFDHCTRAPALLTGLHCSAKPTCVICFKVISRHGLSGFRMKIPMKLVYQYIIIFFNFALTSNHFHPLQVENCDSNSRLVVNEDDYDKFRLERVKHHDLQVFSAKLNKYQ